VEFTGTQHEYERCPECKIGFLIPETESKITKITKMKNHLAELQRQLDEDTADLNTQENLIILNCVNCDAEWTGNQEEYEAGLMPKEGSPCPICKIGILLKPEESYEDDFFDSGYEDEQDGQIEGLPPESENSCGFDLWQNHPNCRCVPEGDLWHESISFQDMDDHEMACLELTASDDAMHVKPTHYSDMNERFLHTFLEECSAA
jgi:hypothetical protein